ncbi:MAG: hypothetical protein IRZ09_14605, partial [Variibacter sp.]|nr:hypothetical protein [Variibacter sp.]
KRVSTIAIRPPPPAARYDPALLSPEITVVAAPPAPPVAREAPQRPGTPFRCPGKASAASGPPTAAQIAQIEAALRLSPEQEKLWRPVAGALREIARHFENPAADPRRGQALLSVERMQQIYLMAGPLVMSLREEQKRAARDLACGMGLAAVAALI